MKQSVLFYVQHLWGVGHVYRATRIANGLAEAGLDVHLVWGGTRLPGFDFTGMTLHELPAVRTSDASFSQLLHADGTEFSDQDKADRRDQLLSIFDKISPDILLTEAFPFGRRQMRFELLPLLDRVRGSNKRILVASSIRDIMQEDRKETRVLESNELVRNHFDLVLVHGDPRLIKIDETLQGVDSFADKIRYTGLVVPEEKQRERKENKRHDVMVSVGGGAFGKQLLEAALEAAKLPINQRKTWLVTTGTEMAQDEFEAIKASASDNVHVVRHIKDMVSAMRSSAVSVSHAGYNTVADILRAQCKSVLYPYIGGRETEQLRRAKMMARLGISECVDPEEFSVQSLSDAIVRAESAHSKDHEIDIQGVRKTAEILMLEFHTLS